MFWGLWAIGSALNVLVVSAPMLVIDGFGGLADVRLWSLLLVLHLWIGCDHSIPAKSARHYVGLKMHHDEAPWFPVLSGIVILLAVWLGVLERTLVPTPPDLLWVTLGVVVASAGLFIRFWAVRALGSFFTEELKLLEGQPLVTTGPYRWIRHPSYAGILLILAGCAALLESVAGAAFVVLVMVPVVGIRVRMEERMLLDGFGESYAAYRRRSARLVPSFRALAAATRRS